ncbi:MAG: hypothetical protein ABEJ24_04585 [Candidatus Magasanikbacteria bacterium]
MSTLEPLEPLRETWSHAFERDLEFLCIIKADEEGENEFGSHIILSLDEEKEGTLLEKRIKREVSKFLLENDLSYQSAKKGHVPEDEVFFFHWQPTDGEGDPYPCGFDTSKEAV